MPNYGLKYKTEFSSLSEEDYSIEFWFKDYTGNIRTVTCGDRPVIHRWDKDEPKAAIKGSSVTVTIVNEGNLPLEAFYSSEDDGVLVKVWWGSQLVFSGILVQDDCSEPLLDASHYITLSANDSLGLLKDIKLNEAFKSVQYTVDTFNANMASVGGINTFYITPVGGTRDIQSGDLIVISGPTFSGTYHVISASVTAGVNAVVVSETLPNSGAETGIVTILRTPSLNVNRISLMEIISAGLNATDIDLNIHDYTNIHETAQDVSRSMLSQTFVDPGSFLVNETDYENCYSVIEKILDRFNASLFQANGVWNIIRRDEHRYYTNIPGKIYSINGDYIGTTTLSNAFNYQPGDPETGLTGRIFRPFKFDKETFNYRRPNNILKNHNFLKVGNLLSRTTVNTGINLQTISEYEMAYWDQGFTWAVGGATLLNSDLNRRIRVIQDYTGHEIQRYGVIKGPTTIDNPSGAVSQPIEVNAGDKIKLSFRFKTTKSQPGGALNLVFDFNLVTKLPLAPRGGNNRYLASDGSWKFTRNFTYSVPAGLNTNDWQEVSIESDRIPFNGLLFIKLAQAVLGATAADETHYKDFNLVYTAYINDSIKIIGHSHTSEQDLNIKNTEDVEISCDDSPRNYAAGTLFLSGMDGVIRKRTTKWKRATVNEAVALGEIATDEQLYWRRAPRNILEGDIRGLIQDSKHFSMLSVMRFTMMQGRYYVPGRLEIDYRNNSWHGTAWEIGQDGETAADLTSEYEFKYLYDLPDK